MHFSNSNNLPLTEVLALEPNASTTPMLITIVLDNLAHVDKLNNILVESTFLCMSTAIFDKSGREIGNIGAGKHNKNYQYTFLI